MFTSKKLFKTRATRSVRSLLFTLIFLTAIVSPASAQTLATTGFAYKKITQASELSTPAEYVLVCEATNSVMTGVSDKNKGSVGSCTLNEGVLSDYVTTPLTLTLKNSGNYYNIQCSGKYLKPTDNGTDLTLVSESSKIKISFDNNGNAMIGSYKGSRNISLYSGQLGHYSSYGNDTYKAVQLYRKVYAVTFPEATQGLTTFYNADYLYTLPNDVAAFAVSAAEEGQPVTMSQVAPTKNVVKKGTALLLKSTPGTTQYLPTTTGTQSADLDATNLLEGGRTEDGITATSKEGNVYYYKLAIKDGQLGFYWGAEGGAAFKMTKPTTAYLAVPQTTAQASALRIDLEAITGIAAVSQGVSNRTDGKAYGIDGRPCTTPKKGLYIINGKKIIR